MWRVGREKTGAWQHGWSLIVVVVSPLVNFIKDQVYKLANLGILAASLSEITEENAGCCGRKNFNRINYMHVRK